MVEGHLEIENVGMTYSTKRGSVSALENFCLEVKPSELVSIIGPSGCGKSTLLSIIVGLLKPSTGRVLLDGNPIVSPRPEVGIVFQEYTNLPWKNVTDNISLGLKYRGMCKEECLKISSDVIKMVGLQGFERSYPHELSGGMKQRVALGRTLAYNPAVILLDEPFGALDAQTREILQNTTVEIWQKTKKTVMHVTHSVSEAIILADRVVVVTARPGTVKEIFPLDHIPRPRIDSPNFIKTVRRLRELIKEEVAKMM